MGELSQQQHGPDCEGPDEDGYWFCPISSDEPGLCPRCLHQYGLETPMTKTWNGRRTANPQPDKIWYLCYLCAHGSG